MQIELKSTSGTDIHDITPRVEEVVRNSGVGEGVCVVHAPGSTASVTTIEYESGALSDLKNALERIAPRDGSYEHNKRWGDGNGYSHVRAALVGPSLSIPITRGGLCLGTWQQVVVLDFDNRSRSRRVMIQVLGEPA